MTDTATPQLERQGVVYVATGRKYYDEACISVRSLKASNRLRAAIFTDQPQPDPHFDIHIPVKSTGDGFLDKVVNLKGSPFEQTLFLDTDTFVCSDLTDLFSLLEHFDLAVAHDHLVREVYPVAGVPQAYPEFNTGVLLFRNNQAVRTLLDGWVETFRKEKELFSRKKVTGKGFPDQPPFRKAVYVSNLRIATLPPEYNCMFRYAGSVVGEVKILHCARIGYGWYTYENLQCTARLLNSRQTARVFCNGELIDFQRKARAFLPSLLDSYEQARIGRLFPRLWQRRLGRLMKKLFGSTTPDKGR
jgi:hypothetical protein